MQDSAKLLHENQCALRAITVQVSVGRLGVITGATFRIRKNEPIKRDLLTTNMAGYASKLMAIQENYNKATTPADKAAAIANLNLMQTTW